MNKKKAIVCTVLFVTVVMGALCGSIFIRNETFDFSLYRFVVSFLAGIWIGERTMKFYDWLLK